MPPTWSSAPAKSTPRSPPAPWCCSATSARTWCCRASATRWRRAPRSAGIRTWTRARQRPPCSTRTPRRSWCAGSCSGATISPPAIWTLRGPRKATIRARGRNPGRPTGPGCSPTTRSTASVPARCRVAPARYRPHRAGRKSRGGCSFPCSSTSACCPSCSGRPLCTLPLRSGRRPPGPPSAPWQSSPRRSTTASTSWP
ncbi:hypothetical protein DFJ74DRAFT_667694 [Hyaloraphidium curvatum]|nr:hypothetical protein DFJ74DRAFT_667694 [Hyaloraphidium curvatum]